MYFKKYS
ncbi:hypothetical protein AYI68_g5588, partial [Smittium mucronatum]